MTEPTSGAVEPIAAASVLVAAADVDRAELAIGELSPGGFELAELDDGSVRFTVYLPVGEEHRLGAWLASHGIELAEAPSIDIVAEDWDQRWRAFHQPVVVGELWVGPPWQLDAAPDGMRRVVIEPAQGFGTGAHPTTRLVLDLLQRQPRSSVLDLGCGSGVLAIAASMLGFGPVTAVDNDQLAVDATRDNADRNDVRDLDVRLLDVLAADVPRADLVLANVLLEPLVRLAPRMVAPRLVLSGLLRSQADECTAAYEQHGYVLRERRDRDGWVALVLDDGREDAEPMRHRAVW